MITGQGRYQFYDYKSYVDYIITEVMLNIQLQE